MNDMLHLRGGERLNPAEFPAEALDEMHDRLDAIDSEELVVGETTGLLVPAPRRRTRFEVWERALEIVAHVLAGLAVLVLLGLWIGEGMGWLS